MHFTDERCQWDWLPRYVHTPEAWDAHQGYDCNCWTGEDWHQPWCPMDGVEEIPVETDREWHQFPGGVIP